MGSLGSLFLNTRSAPDQKKTVSVVVQLYPYLNFICFCLWVWQCMMMMRLTQTKAKFNPRIKLNHNICAMIESSLTTRLERRT